MRAVWKACQHLCRCVGGCPVKNCMADLLSTARIMSGLHHQGLPYRGQQGLGLWVNWDVVLIGVILRQQGLWPLVQQQMLWYLHRGLVLPW